jgi:hypothetical protein
VKHFIRAALVVFGLLAPSTALAIDRDACAVPYQEAQVLRKKRLFSAAMEQLDLCRARCPAVLAADCTQWSAELRALTPTIVFHVHDPAGRVVDAFHVSMNGTLLCNSPGEEPVPVDPGEHVFRFEAQGFAASDAHATLNEGEHRRVVDVTVVPLAAGAPRSPPSVVVEPQAPSGAAAYVFGGVGVLGLAAGGALTIAGFVEKANLETACSPLCPPGSVDTIRTTWLAGGISAAAGAASIAVGAVLWFRPRAPAAKVAWTPIVGVGTLGVVGRF